MLLFPDNIAKDKLPTVTIIIANYNYGQYVKDAIESAIKQTYEKMIIMIVDDCSTDNSHSVIYNIISGYDNFSEHDFPEFKMFVSNKNGKDVVYMKLKKHVNVSTARNHAIELGMEKTDYYMILDADDVAYPEKTTELAATLFINGNIGVAYSDYYIYNVESGTTTPEFKEPYSKKRLMEECIVHSGAMIRKQALIDTKDQFGYYDANMRTCEDYDLWMRISEKYMIAHVPKLLSLVRVHKNNSTNVIQKQEWENNWRRIVQKTKLRNG